MGSTKNHSPTTTADIDSLLCTSNVKNSDVPASIGFSSTGAKNLDNYVGMDFYGSLIGVSLTSNLVDPYFPNPTTSSKPSDMDNCSGMVDKDLTIKVFGLSPCMGDGTLSQTSSTCSGTCSSDPK